MDPDGSGSITPNSHPNESVLLAFSDLASFYGHSDSDSGQRTQSGREVAISRKLGFYAARVVCMPTMALRALADEALARSKLILLESGGGEETESLISPSSRATPVRSRLIIEEL